jgi:hypothetical protein
MKDLLKILIILSCFGLMGSATFVKLKPLDPCRGYVNNLLFADTSVRASVYDFVNDTVVVSTIKDSLWDIKTQQICNVLRDSCKVSGRKVLVVNQSVVDTSRDTRFGKKIYFRTCP